MLSMMGAEPHRAGPWGGTEQGWEGSEQRQDRL